jgi:hypothetical protein
MNWCAEGTPYNKRWMLRVRFLTHRIAVPLSGVLPFAALVHPVRRS